MYSICFTIAGVIFSILLFIIYSFKTNFSISENKIYHSIIITTIITGLIEIYSFILVKNNIPENSNLYLFALKFLFLGFVTWLYLFTLYTVIVTLKLKDKDNDKYRIILVISSIIFTILSIITIILPISINKVGDLLLPTGSGVEVIYLLAVLCFVIMIISIISNHRELKNKKYYPVYFLLVILGIMILIQKIFPDLLLINFSLSIIIYIMYFTIENPDIKLSKELKYTKELLNKRNELASNTINNLIISIKEPLTEIANFSNKKINKCLNRSAIIRIFENILSNVLKYSNGNFEVILNDDGIITFSNKANSLDAITVQKIFDRYFTVENAKESTGIGLAIAKQLIEQNRGKITAEYVNGYLIIKLYL